MDRLRSVDAINTSVSATQITRSDLVDQGVVELVRASVYAYNTETEIEKLVQSVERLANEVRLSRGKSRCTVQ